MAEDDQLDGAGAEPRDPAPPSALPVLVQPSAPVPRVMRTGAMVSRERSSLPVVQAAAVAAGSFVAGAAVAGLMHRRHRSAPAVAGGRAARALGRRRGQRSGKAVDLLEIVGSRSLLVDVHLLGLPASER
jgi:hypothetical protein